MKRKAISLTQAELKLVMFGLRVLDDAAYNVFCCREQEIAALVRKIARSLDKVVS